MPCPAVVSAFQYCSLFVPLLRLMMLDPHTVVGSEVREICGLRVCLAVRARSFFVLFFWASQVGCL